MLLRINCSKNCGENKNCLTETSTTWFEPVVSDGDVTDFSVRNGFSLNQVSPLDNRTTHFFQDNWPASLDKIAQEIQQNFTPACLKIGKMLSSHKAN